MPRTKKVVTKQKPATQSELVEYHQRVKIVIDCIRNKKKETLAKLTEEKEKMLDAYKLFFKEEFSNIPHKYWNMTINEPSNREHSELTDTVSCASKESLLNITKSVKTDKRKVKRSASFVDEGYLTAESNSGRRTSRSKTKQTRPRKSRSLSKTNGLKTPANKVSPDSYGVVTPKCKPNTPQVILRRPRNGEVALSMQGSPLFTASVVSEKVANINIPLFDGRLLTLQPQRGLRVSQIPQFDPETWRQLQMLSENLNKVVATKDAV